jgi:hypothetical protein
MGPVVTTLPSACARQRAGNHVEPRRLTTSRSDVIRHCTRNSVEARSMIRPLPRTPWPPQHAGKTQSRQRIVEAAAERRPGACACVERNVSEGR